MASQLDLPSLTLLSAAGCGRQQLEAVHWHTSVTLLQVLENWPHKVVVIDYPLGAPGQRRLYLTLSTYVGHD